ncbi:hypothetical protein EMCRGX_G006084, partial [Ephydatia muelleri]
WPSHSNPLPLVPHQMALHFTTDRPHIAPLPLPPLISQHCFVCFELMASHSQHHVTELAIFQEACQVRAKVTLRYLGTVGHHRCTTLVHHVRYHTSIHIGFIGAYSGNEFSTL